MVGQPQKGDGVFWEQPLPPPLLGRPHEAALLRGERPVSVGAPVPMSGGNQGHWGGEETPLSPPQLSGSSLPTFIPSLGSPPPGPRALEHQLRRTPNLLPSPGASRSRGESVLQSELARPERARSVPGPRAPWLAQSVWVSPHHELCNEIRALCRLLHFVWCRRWVPASWLSGRQGLWPRQAVSLRACRILGQDERVAVHPTALPATLLANGHSNSRTRGSLQQSLRKPSFPGKVPSLRQSPTVTH